ncbi:MAG: hypothetical protein JXB50_09755 [Spirochaetes bacterium]|nr:hypothetical protein [Spirochaetota bacterium]
MKGRFSAVHGKIDTNPSMDKGVNIMAKKVLDASFFDDESGDIIDKIIREEELLISRKDEVKKPDIEKEEMNLNDVIEFYHKKLFENDRAIEYLKSKNIKRTENQARFKIGFADGSLINILSKKQKKELAKTGLIDETGKEVFLNCLIIPIFDSLEKVTGIYGVNIDEGRAKTIWVDDDKKRAFNLKASKVYDEVILTDSIIKALRLIDSGIENVVSIAGDEGFTAEALIALKENRVKTVVLSFNDINSPLIETLKELFIMEEIAVKIASLNGNENKNEILELIKNASLFKKESDKLKEKLNVKKDDLYYIFEIDEVKYKLTGVKEIYSINLRVHIKAEINELFHHDTVDLYSAKSRSDYAARLAKKFDIEAVIIEKDLDKIVNYLEEEKSKNREGKEVKEELTEEERQTGLTFLQSPDLFDRIIDDMTTLGYVGEDLNKKLLYLCASSRKLDDPISILIVSQSASGKSMLVDTVKRLIPDDEVISVTSLSDQALNYIENLSNKFLVFGESVHNEVIEHQIREMLSSKELTRLVTVKDEKTGKMRSELVRKKVIVSSVMSTTNHKLNPENATRYFLINADESKEQTKRIHEIQKEKYTLKRQYVKDEVIPSIIRKHKIAQAMLKKVIIVNDFAKYLNFPDSTMRTRRDHDRFIDLIACVCFLRQYQKEIKINGHHEYIECDLADYEEAYNIMINGVLSSTMNDLPAGTINLYEEVRILIKKLAKEKKLNVLETIFTQRELREFTQFGGEFIKKHLRILVDYEYIILESGKNKGTKYSYRLKSDEEIQRIDLKVIPTPVEMRELLQKL